MPPTRRSSRAGTGVAAGVHLAAEFRAADRLNAAVAQSPALAQVLQLLAFRIEREAKRNAPVDTGRLRASISTRLVPGPTGPVAEVGTNVAYAAAQEYGTRHGVPPTRYLGRALQTVAQQLTTPTRRR